jgi:hypothetical protein
VALLCIPFSANPVLANHSDAYRKPDLKAPVFQPGDEKSFRDAGAGVEGNVSTFAVPEKNGLAVP